MVKLLYFDISSDFGFFKKPDVNRGNNGVLSLTYNIPPKPAILGILGSILGMKGLVQHYDENVKLRRLLDIKNVIDKDYNKAKKFAAKLDFSTNEILKNMEYTNATRFLELINLLKSSNKKEFEPNIGELQQLLDELQSELTYPEYYRKLNHLKIGITPIGKFPFNKIMNKYNSKNSYFGDAKYENVLVSEQLLIKPKYSVYAYDEASNDIITELFQRMKTNSPVFMPYLGKNEFIANFQNINIGNVEEIFLELETKIYSIFLSRQKEPNNTTSRSHNPLFGSNGGTSISVEGLPFGYLFYEHYPTNYNGVSLQYELRLVQFTSDSVAASEIDMSKGKLLTFDNKVVYVF